MMHVGEEGRRRWCDGRSSGDAALPKTALRTVGVVNEENVFGKKLVTNALRGLDKNQTSNLHPINRHYTALNCNRCR